VSGGHGGGAGKGGTGGGAGKGGTGGSAGKGGTSGLGGAGGNAGTGGSGGGGTTGEDSGANCTIPALPSYASLPTNPKLPDPFKALSGSRITTQADWTCRRAEISALARAFVLGTKPSKPSSVTASFSAGTLNITCSNGGKTIAFSVTITKPTSGSGPFPALIGVGGSSLPSLTSKGVALITFDSDELAAEADATSRGQGKFFDLYGSSLDSGALIAHAWGVSRIIDALEVTPSAGIDTTRLAVTGCSHFGRSALVAGAFDERIALTVPQESGVGGAGAWRIADSEFANGKNVQTASEAVGENCWFGTGFNQFANTTGKLPIDQHEILALCAPRGLLVIENDIDWLGPVATYGGAKAAHKVFEALGVPDHMGITLSANHAHCAFPSSQQAALDAFVTRFLLNGSANTTVDDTIPTATFDESAWIDWTTPALT
jgi:hypothetical protein